MNTQDIIARAIYTYASGPAEGAMERFLQALDEAGLVVVETAELARIRAAMPETVVIKVDPKDTKGAARGAAVHRRLMGRR